MEFNRFGITPIVVFNFIVWLLFTFAYLYQVIYVLIAAKRGMVKIGEAKKNHTYAFFIAAHNEDAVIAQLVQSIKSQDYPKELFDVFVVADACTDATAQRAREAGAIVYERNDLARKGKSWVMDYGFDRILNEYGDKYEAFIVFDADNLLSPTYLLEMNKVFDAGYLVSTSYRNSKNFDSSWVSSAMALWFLREAKFLNNPRMMLNTSCAISGSGWLVSTSIVRGMHGWDFHTLTEDIQFSTFCASQGIQIAYAPAEFYDEQPITLAASWTQRMRWTKGFYEVFFSYVGDLFHCITKGERRRFGSYDMLMTIAPGNLLSLLSVFVNSLYLIVGSLSRGYLATQSELSMCVGSLFMTFASMYVTFFILGVVTTISERKHIRCAPDKRWRIYSNLFTFPLFMMTYIPMTVVALFKKVEWVPTKHTVAISMNDMKQE